MAGGVRIRVLAWHPEHAWTNWDGAARAQLVKRLVSSTQLRRLEIKRLARSIMAGELVTIDFQNDTETSGVQHVLESLGAEVQIEYI